MRKGWFSLLCTSFCFFGTSSALADSYYSEDFFSNPLPILYQEEEKDCTIYGIKSSGVIVCYQGESQFFDWQWQNSIYELPQVTFADFDGDGAEELSFLSNLYNGPGTATQTLYLLDDIEQCLPWTDYIFSEDILKDQLQKSVSFTNNTMQRADQTISVPFYPQKHLDNITLVYPDILVEDTTITVFFSIAIFYDDSVIPDVLNQEWKATLSYKDGTYQLQNIQLLSSPHET